MQKNIINEYAKQIIYDDSKTLLSLIHNISMNPIVAAQIMPFMSLFCAEAFAFCENHDIALSIPSAVGISANDIRMKLKLFEDKYSKTKKIVSNCDYLQDYIFRNQLRFGFMKNWNIHYNLGVFFDSDDNIVGNSQLGYYIYQDNELLKKKIEDVKYWQIL